MFKRSHQGFLLSTFYFLLSRKKGFTIIEVLVAVSITIFLSSALILYNSRSREQTSLYLEQGKVAQIISRAKSLAISTYARENNCGYGVRFDYANSKYYIFAYGGAPVNCATVAQDGIDLQFESEVAGFPPFQLNPVLIFGSGQNRLTDVLFIPPDPETVIMTEGDAFPVENGTVYLQTKDGLAGVSVKVGVAGQITL